MSSSTSDVIKFYVRLFTALGIQLRPKQKTRTLGWKAFRFISSILILVEVGSFFRTCYELFSALESHRHVLTKRFDFSYFTYMVGVYYLLTFLTHFCVWVAIQKIDIAKVIKFIKQVKNDDEKVNERVQKCLRINKIAAGFNIIVLVLVVVCMLCELSFKKYWFWKDLTLVVCIIYAVPLAFIQTHFCLFFSVLMELLSDSLASPPKLNMTGLSREFISNYERVRKLAKIVNCLFSPVLALACASNLLGVATILAFVDLKFYAAVMLMLPATIPNFISSLLCLNSITKCNQKRLQWIHRVSKSFSKVNKHTLRLIERSLNFNYWLINVLLTDEDWFNIGCYVPMDETIFLMVFQNVFDLRMAMNYTFDFLGYFL